MQARSMVMRAACVVALVCGACKAEDAEPMMNAGTGGAAGTGAVTGGVGGGGAGGQGGASGEAGTTAGTAGTGDTGGAAGMAPVTGGVGGEGGAAGMEVTGGTGGDGDTNEFPDLRGTCVDFPDTGFPGDDKCIPPPAPEEGFQIHVGPSDYSNPGSYVIHMGEENSVCASFRTPNTEDVYYQGSILSGRPGTHHIINTMYVKTQVISPGNIEACLDFGTGMNANIVDNLPGASKAYMPRSPVAPENEHLGRSIPADSPAQGDMHYFNFTEGDLLREFWINIYVVPASQITDEMHQIRGMGGLGWSIQPGTDHVYQYSANVTGPGRIVALLGHYHAHGKRFGAYLQRGTTQTKVFEMFDYNEPAEFSYDSISTNPPFATGGAMTAGATSGMLEIQAGDKLQWECHIINDSNVVLDYSNHVQTGEMCNLWGVTVGPVINQLAIFETPFAVTP